MTLAAAAQAARAADRIAALQTPVLARRSDMADKDRPPFQVHLSAAPVTPIELPRVGSDRTLQAREVDYEGPFGRLVFRLLDGVWRPVFRGQRMVNERKDFDASAAVFSDGSCELRYALTADRSQWYDEEAQFYLGWHLGALTALLVWCEAIRKAAEEPSLEFAMGQLITCDSDGVRLQVQQGALGRLGTMPVTLAVPPPDVFAGADDIDRLLNAAVADFNTPAGRAGPVEAFHFDLDPVRKAWGVT